MDFGRFIYNLQIKTCNFQLIGPLLPQSPILVYIIKVEIVIHFSQNQESSRSSDSRRISMMLGSKSRYETTSYDKKIHSAFS